MWWRNLKTEWLDLISSWQNNWINLRIINKGSKKRLINRDKRLKIGIGRFVHIKNFWSKKKKRLMKKKKK